MVQKRVHQIRALKSYKDRDERNIIDLDDSMKKTWDGSNGNENTVIKVYKIIKDNEIIGNKKFTTSSANMRTMKFDVQRNELN